LDEVDRLIEEGNAHLSSIDRVESESKKDKSWGSMAITSFKSGAFYQAMEKFRQAGEILEKREQDA
jgi:hypothetical protein